MVRVERELRAEAEQRAAAAAELAAQMRAAAAAQAAAPHPSTASSAAPPGVRPQPRPRSPIRGRHGVGLPAHVEEAILNVRSVFIASEELGGLTAYLNR
ncbi:hypothetical protein NKG94_01625 [Micromonospora sp. M12]